MILDDIILSMKDKMEKCLLSLKYELLKVIVNKINISIIDDIKIHYYGEFIKINQVSTIISEKGNYLLIKPFNKKDTSPIYNSLLDANLNLNLSIYNESIKVTFFELTEEKRLFFVKKVRKLGEMSKISIRNIRKNANQKFKLLKKENNLSLDKEKIYINKINLATQDYIKKIDSLINKKSKDLIKI